MEEVKILELTERCIKYFQEHNYTESRISRYKSLWRNGIIRYMSQRGIESYSPAVGADFVQTCHFNGTIRPQEREKIRSVQVLDDLMLSVSLYFCPIFTGRNSWALVYFIKFILNVNRNEVFCMKNVNLLRKYGTCAILIGVGLIILTLAIITESSFADALSDGIGALSEGFFALLMGEVFKIGLNLQEGKNVTA